MKVLVVLTSNDTLGNTGKKTGFWLEEFAAPYYVFKDAAAEITLASPRRATPARPEKRRARLANRGDAPVQRRSSRPGSARKNAAAIEYLRW